MTQTKLGKFTQQEIASQPQAWADGLAHLQKQALALHRFWNGNYEQVIFTGCGSPYYAALAAAASARLGGLNAIAVPASEIWLNHTSAYVANTRTLLVALSRSGETTELIRACNAFRERGEGNVLTVTCYPKSKLAQMGQHNLVLTSGQEESFAQTRAFTLLHLGTLFLGVLWSGNDMVLKEFEQLPKACQKLMDDYAPMLRGLGEDAALNQFYFLGSGARHGLAHEMSLKMKEMSISHSEPFHFLEFRHGPQTMVNEHTLVVGLVSEANAAQELAVLSDMRALGGRTLALGEQGCDVNFAAGVSENARGPLYVVAGQLLAYTHALSNGRNPDRPHNLQAVVKLV